MNKLILLVLIGCGSSSPPGEPLVSGSVSATYQGAPFMPTYGFATTYMNSGLIGFGEDKLHCGTENSPIPPSGNGVIVQLPSLAVGNYSDAFIQVFHNAGGHYTSSGSTGTVNITAVDTTVAGMITFSFTDTDTSQTYSANGTFEVINCMP
jgi:hypothetical protein